MSNTYKLLLLIIISVIGSSLIILLRKNYILGILFFIISMGIGLIIYFINKKENLIKLKIKQKKGIKDMSNLLHQRFMDLDDNTRKTIVSNKLGNIPIYYINLDRSQDRLISMIDQIKLYNIQNITRIEAIEGKNIDNIKEGSIPLYKNVDIKFVNNYNKIESKAVLGCTLSHLKAIKTSYDNGDDISIIMEDDVNFSMVPFGLSINEIIKQIPEDWSIINLFTNGPKKCLNTVNKVISWDKYKCWSTLVYIINRKGMKEILDDMKGEFILDTKVSNKIEADAYINNKVKKYYYYTKASFFPIDTSSSIGYDHIEVSLRASYRHLKKIMKIYFSTNNVSIPCILHQTWKTKKLPENFRKWSTECKQLYLNWKYILWTDDKNRDFIKKYYPWFLSVYDNYDKNIKRVDAVRYFLLYHYGGVYMDLDFLCLKDFSPLLKKGHAIFGYQLHDINAKGSIANAFMASPPYHPLFEKIIHTLYKYKHLPVLEATGPVFLTNMIKNYSDIDVIIYKMPILYTHEWNDKSIKSKDCTNSTQKCKSHFPNSYTSTVWTHTWK